MADSHAGNARLLADLTVTADRLTVATDELDKALQTIQDQIVRTNVGAEVWVSIPDSKEWQSDTEDGIDHWTEYQLGYAKFSDNWTLLTRFVDYLSDAGNGQSKWEYSNDKPLLRSPREVRLGAVKAIPELVAKIHEAARKTLALVDEAKALAQAGETKLETPEGTIVPCLAGAHCLVVGDTAYPIAEDGSKNTNHFLTIGVMGTGTQNGDQLETICRLTVNYEGLIDVLLTAVEVVDPQKKDEGYSK
jgi:hypothetical protein